ncbi:short-chain dehydrogenase [Mycobacterium sp. 852002-53434_SCH5985345]|uniref:SDR family NAD(P)-dependent oxidoreductase n=1 Tax=unclassified Mycobacterium TaxID=2642494 RepID=UPI0007FE654D|nr:MULTISPECIES: SDR family NAD(P)-dependent oxidoreductase [unclassified Mycobacterium]OBF50347.1 short-chain dehydrogenase [Mycobacterium sp. 852002-53434_SCH5985345]OBF77731.1 short-chain dehydrogenase [Mycobacterium sp. 852002-51613_SCH5001154]OBF96517.1 short-chain dehydrogenase [Mycobacterium sp. 852014-52450_SCH5900713]
MTRRTIVITGASDGIGAAAARRLHRSGANVVVVGRTQSKIAVIAAELNAAYFAADFADLCQVRALADKIRSECPRIDVLGNNAGGVFSKLRNTADGHEITLQVNYLAPFLLTTMLLDVLVASHAVIVNTSSSSQRLLRHVTLDDFETTARRTPSTAYALAKLANILFTKELHRRYHADGLSAAVVHPGFVNTNIGHSSGSRFLTTMQRTPVSRLIKTPDRGADQLVWLASSTPGVDWASGEYYARGKVARANRAADDPVLARELWDRALAKVT